MPADDLTARLAREPERLVCPLCRHRLTLPAPAGRCEQCGSEVHLYDDRQAARAALEALTGAGRVAYLTETERGLFAVTANRSFRSADE